MFSRDRDQTPVIQAPTSRGARRRWVVHGVYGAAAGSRWVIEGGQLLLGRSPGPGVTVLPDGQASRQHVAFTASAAVVRVEDLGSTNGTWCGGHRIDRPVDLCAGAVVRVGQSLLVLAQETADDLPPPPGDLGILGRSGAVAELRRVVALAAPSHLPILVLGPTGSGKELISRAVHTCSRRRGELVVVNSAALPSTLVESSLFGHRRGAFTDARADEPGAFVRADGGTLFLDEIGDMPLDAQAKLLRTLETGEVVPVGGSRPLRVDVRVVAATHRPVVGQDATLREDLYARVAGVVVQVPRLADRREDVFTLFDAFSGAGGSARFDVHAAEQLLLYGWPRNIRELKRVAERLELLHGAEPVWTGEHLGELAASGVSVGAPPDHDEGADDEAAVGGDPAIPWPPTRESLQALLDDCGGNVSLAAERVGRNRKQIYRWRDRLGL